MRKSATLSPCGKFRFDLWRVWDEAGKIVNFCGLNPSVADHEIDDATIRRDIRFARDWGYGGFVKTNAFAFRSTSRDVMKRQIRPEGDPENAEYIRKHAFESALVICCWGEDGGFRDRDRSILSMLSTIPLHCLHLTNSGRPGHELYLPANSRPIPFNKIAEPGDPTPPPPTSKENNPA
jgi:hypothetical protein